MHVFLSHPGIVRSLAEDASQRKSEQTSSASGNTSTVALLVVWSRVSDDRINSLLVRLKKNNFIMIISSLPVRKIDYAMRTTFLLLFVSQIFVRLSVLL
jgi:hypothetical protein